MNPGCAAEQAAWRELKDGWRPLYGDVDKIGVAIEWHDFRIDRPFNWGRTFHPNSLEFCLNLSGHGAVGKGGGRRSDYVQAIAAITLSPINRWRPHVTRMIVINSSRSNFRASIYENSWWKMKRILNRR